MASKYYISDAELEEWLERRFGPKNLFNRQLARDLLNWGVQAVLDSEDPRHPAERLETRR